jgi:hypothetical protein
MAGVNAGAVAGAHAGMARVNAGTITGGAAGASWAGIASGVTEGGLPHAYLFITRATC